MENIITLARDFAAMAHQGQTINGTDVPYIAHCAQVAGLVQADTSNGDEMIAAAWLHDVLEDTDITFEDIVNHTNRNVAKLVLSLTDQSPEGNRAERMAAERTRLGKVSLPAKVIKTADIISNLTYSSSLKPSFRKVYANEKRELLRELETFEAEPLFELAHILIKTTLRQCAAEEEA